MKIVPQDQTLLIALEGELNSVTTPAVNKEIQEAIAANPGLVPAFDAEKLLYISSTGLRMLLTFCKQFDRELLISNVSSEVYDIMDITGFTSLMTVQRRMREISVEGCEIIGQGAFGTVYRIDADTVVKVYRSADLLPMIRNEQKRARQAFLRGIPTAIPFDVVKVDSRYGSVFEMVKARNCGERLIEEPERIEEILDRYVSFIKTVHGVEMLPGELPDTRSVYAEELDRVAKYLPEETASRLRELIAAVPESLHVVHGDIQMKNVMLSDDTEVLIDMDTLSVGNPVFEFAGLFMSYIAFNEDDPDDALQFLGIDTDTCRRVYSGILSRYLGGDAGRIRAADDRIRLLGYLRFLYVVATAYDTEAPLRRVQIARAVSQMGILKDRVTSLAL